MRAAISVLAQAAGKRILVLGDMGELGGEAATFHAEIGGEARRAGIERLYALGDLSVNAVREFGSGARHFDGIEDLQAALEKELDADTTVLVKGFAIHENGTRGAVSGSRDGRRTWGDNACCCATRTMVGSGCKVLQRVQLHHVARRAGGDDGAVHLVPGRPDDDTQTDRVQDRPVGAQRRPADASGQGRHADHGRRADPDLDRDHHPAVGRLAQPLRVGGAAHHAGFRRDRLGG